MNANTMYLGSVGTIHHNVAPVDLLSNAVDHVEFVKPAFQDYTVVAEVAKKSVMEQLAEEYRAFKQFEESTTTSSNQKLYQVLAKCFAYYKAMNDGGDEGKKLKDELGTFTNVNGIKFGNKTKPLSKIVRCVVGAADTRKINAYCTVITYAEAKGCMPEDLVAFITANGGVQNVRTKKYAENKAKLNKPSRTEMLQVATTNIELQQLAVINNADIYNAIPTGRETVQVVLIATPMPDGTFVVNAAVSEVGVVNAALKSFYKNSPQLHSANAAPEPKPASATELIHALTNVQAV